MTTVTNDSTTSQQPASGGAAARAWHWTWARFDDLGVHALHDALALRCRVFILEQGPYQDPDDADKHAWHLLGRAQPDGPLLAVLRVVDPGVKYAEPSMGRVATAAQARGTGLGRALIHEGMQRCRQAWPGHGVRISAQAHLQRFYAEQGFVTVSEPYLEDDIPHVEMLWSPPPPPMKDAAAA